MTYPELINLSRRLGADTAGLDFDAAIDINGLISERAPCDQSHLFYRHCIHEIVVTHRASWGRLIRLGRNRFYNALDRDEQACFRAAQLMAEEPAEETVAWWDRLAGAMRSAFDVEKMAQARRAELLTIAHEIGELQRLGIDRTPKWMGVEDNTVGFDVLSYRKGHVSPTNVLIEVKSTTASPLRFTVTRNEWNVAMKSGAAYLFYIWDMIADPPRVHVRTVEQLAEHMPVDRRLGKWSHAEIPLAAK